LPFRSWRGTASVTLITTTIARESVVKGNRVVGAGRGGDAAMGESGQGLLIGVSLFLLASLPPPPVRLTDTRFLSSNYETFL